MPSRLGGTLQAWLRTVSCCRTVFLALSCDQQPLNTKRGPTKRILGGVTIGSRLLCREDLSVLTVGIRNSIASSGHQAYLIATTLTVVSTEAFLASLTMLESLSELPENEPRGSLHDKGSTRN